MTTKCPLVILETLRPSLAQFFFSLKISGVPSLNSVMSCSVLSSERTVRLPLSDGMQHCWPVMSRDVPPICTAASRYSLSAARMTSQHAAPRIFRQTSSGREGSDDCGFGPGLLSLGPHCPPISCGSHFFFCVFIVPVSLSLLLPDSLLVDFSPIGGAVGCSPSWETGGEVSCSGESELCRISVQCGVWTGRLGSIAK